MTDINQAKPSSIGGAATQAGAAYEVACGAYLAVGMLSGPLAQPAFGLGDSARITSIQCQAESPVDDLVVEMSDGGLLFIQMKRKLVLGQIFNETIGQFVRQYLAMQRNEKGYTARRWARPFEAERDRIILATTSETSEAIRIDFNRLCSRFAADPEAGELNALASNSGERKIADTLSQAVAGSWIAQTGSPPTKTELKEFLRSVRVAILDVSEDQGDQQVALDRLRQNVVRNPSDSRQAWIVLQDLFRQANSNREAVTPNRAYQSLESAKIAIAAPADFRKDIERLKAVTDRTIEDTNDLASLQVRGEIIRVRRSAQAVLLSEVRKGHLVVVGQPGAGKSGVIHELAKDLRSSASDVVFVTVDRVSGQSPSAIGNSMGIAHDFRDVLENWPGSDAGYLIVDALDAARDSASRECWQNILKDVIKSKGRWTVIASIREFDLRYGQEWADLFVGEPVAGFRRSEFRRVRHLDLPPLDDEEIGQFEARISTLAPVLSSSAKLRDLLRNAFNLRLAVSLLDDADATQNHRLSLIRHRVQLLSEYWNRRVRQPAEAGVTNEQSLLEIAGQMIEQQSIRVDRLGLTIDGPAISNLERAHIIRSGDVVSGTNLIQFSHHILLDYSIARLYIGFSISPAKLISLVSSNRDHALFLSPSLRLLFEHLWHDENGAKQFWTLALSLYEAAGVPEITGLHAPSVVADESYTMDELRRLVIDTQKTGDTKPIDRFLWHLVGALALKIDEGSSIVGPEKPWAELAAELSQTPRIEIVDSIRIICWKIVSTLDKATAEQTTAIGLAARNLLHFIWGLPRDQYSEASARVALEAICRTFTTDIAASAETLRQAIDPLSLSDRGVAHIEIPEIARQIVRIANLDPKLAKEIYSVAFSHDESPDDATSIGGSRILALRSNKKQDFESARWQLSESFSKIIKTNAVLGTEITIIALESYARRRKALDDESEQGAEFVTASGRGRFVRDRSYFWLNLDREQTHESELKIVKAFAAYWQEVESSTNASDLFQRCFEVSLAQNRLAAFWARLIYISSERPELYAHRLVDLVAALPVLSASETEFAIGRYFQNAFAILTEGEREGIEHAIFSLRETPRAESAQKFVGLLPEGAIITEEIRALKAEQRASGRVVENRPLVSMTTEWGRAPSAAELLAEDGVQIQSAQDRALLRHIERLEVLRNDVAAEPELEDFRNAEAALEEVLASILGAEGAGATSEVREAALDYFVDLAERFARTRVCAVEPSVRGLLKRIFTVGLTAAHPTPNEDSNRQFAQSPSWGGPSARISAVEGLMNLRFWDAADASEIEGLVEPHIVDGDAAIRYHIAQRVFGHGAHNSSWSRSALDRFARYDDNAGVALGTLHSASRYAAIDQAFAFEIARLVIGRFQVERGEQPQCVEDGYSLICDLYIHLGDEASSEEIARLKSQPIENSDLINALLPRYREMLTVGSSSSGDDPNRTIRQRSVDLFATVARAALAEYETLSERAIDGGELSEEEQRNGQAAARLIDTIATELYFASGAYDERDSGAGKPTLEGARFFEEAAEIIDDLSHTTVVHAAHQLCEMLEWYIDHDPTRVFELIANAVKAGSQGGYAHESLGSSLIVRIIERYIADHPSVFADVARRQDLLSILDIFVAAGWPDARKLVYRIGQIWT